MYLVDQHRKVEVHPQLYRQRILIVEDDVTAEYLIRKHHNQGAPFDLVISHVFLSGQRTGIDLWQRLGEMVPALLTVSIIPHEKFFKLVGSTSKAPISSALVRARIAFAFGAQSESSASATSPRNVITPLWVTAATFRAPTETALLINSRRMSRLSATLKSDGPSAICLSAVK